MEKLKVTAVLALFVAPIFSFSQPKTEIREMNGTVIAVQPGLRFYYSQVVTEVDGVKMLFNFNPRLAKQILQDFVPGKETTFRAKVEAGAMDKIQTWNEEVRSGNKPRGFIIPAGTIVGVQKSGVWNELPTLHDSLGHRVVQHEPRVFIDVEVKDALLADGRPIAFIFPNGVVGAGISLYGGLPGMKSIHVGDFISFTGIPVEIDPRFEYPVANVREVYFLHPLVKMRGTIKSFLYKQNHVCIGLVMKVASGEKRLSFPGPYARKLQSLYDPDEAVTAYCSAWDSGDPLLPPELHLLEFKSETVEIKDIGFYGGADVKHDHKPAQIEGKITKIVHSDRGRIINIVVGNDCYVEFDPNVAAQLGVKIAKGKMLSIKGKERIRKDGEVYDANYRIIVPDEITLDGTTYLVHQQL